MPVSPPLSRQYRPTVILIGEIRPFMSNPAKFVAAGMPGASLQRNFQDASWSNMKRVQKPLVEKMNEITFMVEAAEEGGYVARAVGASIFTEANDLAGLYQSVRDAVQCHYDEPERPSHIRLRFVREEVIAA